MADISETERRFYVRIKSQALDAAERIFPGGKAVSCGEDSEHVGYFTQTMKENLFERGCLELGDGILSKVRIL